jgi:ubiquinone/menaquinone biosynthesis C-methylase UbiE
VILDQTLEHLAEPELGLREIHRILRPGATVLVTTPFLVPVHQGPNYGDYYRWTPKGMETILKKCGFTPRIGMWGNLEAAKALLDHMYMTSAKPASLA